MIERAYSQVNERKSSMPTTTETVVATICDPDSKRGQIIKTVQKQMEFCKSVLELGAGHFEMIGALKCDTRVGVEIHKPYIESRICDRYVIPIHADALDAAKMFPAKSFDGVIMIDFIEHLEKSDAISLLEMIESIARQTVLVHCPVGNHPQEGDAFGLGGEEYQKHRSQWDPKEFEDRGYAVAVLDNFFEEDGVDPRALVAVKRI